MPQADHDSFFRFDVGRELRFADNSLRGRHGIVPYALAAGILIVFVSPTVISHHRVFESLDEAARLLL